MPICLCSPVYGGDEIGQLNDYSYKENPNKAADSRYIHRGAMDWKKAEKISDEDSVEGKIFGRLRRLEQVRKAEKAFVDTWTIETWDSSLLCIGRYFEGEKIIGIFNFSEFDKTAWIKEEGEYRDLMTGEDRKAVDVSIPAYGFYYLKRK